MSYKTALSGTTTSRNVSVADAAAAIVSPAAIVTVHTAVLQNFVSGDGTVVYMLTSLKIPYMILVSALTLYTLLSHTCYTTGCVLSAAAASATTATTSTATVVCIGRLRLADFCRISVYSSC
jgi:hypothetical protein